MPADCRWLERRALKNYKVYSFQQRTKSWKEEHSFRFMLDGILTHDTVPQHTRERCSLTVLHIVESLVDLIMVLVVILEIFVTKILITRQLAYRFITLLVLNSWNFFFFFFISL